MDVMNRASTTVPNRVKIGENGKKKKKKSGGVLEESAAVGEFRV